MAASRPSSSPGFWSESTAPACMALTHRGTITWLVRKMTASTTPQAAWLAARAGRSPQRSPRPGRDRPDHLGLDPSGTRGRTRRWRPASRARLRRANASCTATSSSTTKTVGAVASFVRPGLMLDSRVLHTLYRMEAPPMQRLFPQRSHQTCPSWRAIKTPCDAKLDP